MTIDGKTVFQGSGGAGGARGVNVLVLDSATGIRVTEYRSFDTWADPANHTALINYLDGLPNEALIALALTDEGGFVADDGPPQG